MKRKIAVASLFFSALAIAFAYGAPVLASRLDAPQQALQNAVAPGFSAGDVSYGISFYALPHAVFRLSPLGILMTAGTASASP